MDAGYFHRGASKPPRVVRPGPYGKVAAAKSWQVGPYGKLAARKPQQAGLASPTNRLRSVTPHGLLEDHENVFNCTSLDQWHSLEADDYQGLRVARSIDPCKWQFVADHLSKEFEDSLEAVLSREVIDVSASDSSLQHKFHDAALAVSSRLPPALANLVCKDAQALADVTCKLLPEARTLTMGLQLFGANSCSRWHRDHILCRSIVSYNCSGTQYTADSNVDFQELQNCGKCEHVIRDKSRIQSLDVGDVLLMKGKLYPGKGRGLVHKSPELRYADNGDVQSRLVLTVEVEDLARGKVKNSCNGD